MPLEYSIVYRTENQYEDWVNGASWQFLIIPETNATQAAINVGFTNSLRAQQEFSINGFGFQTIRVAPKERFKIISFEAIFKVIKQEVNPFEFEPSPEFKRDYERLQQLDFKVDFGHYLQKTPFTSLPEKHKDIFKFDPDQSIFDNLLALNHWTFKHIYFKTDVTDVGTPLHEIIDKRHGVCQDFSHLFCALARQNDIPARYVSGYLHQGNGYFGDSQMHAWAEAFIPKIGWMGFDPTNDLMVNTNHIKVAHGKDYNDCSPLRGVVYTSGGNKTSHTVQVIGQQQQ